MLRFIFFGVLSLLAVKSLAQTTINVGPGLTYTTIQSGINAANNGDTVLVAPGTYNENINFNGKAITVTSSGGAAATIIDGGAAPGLATVAFQSNEKRTSTLSNFTVRNGGASTFNSLAGGGIYINGASPAILNNIITANECDGITVNFGSALIQGNTISGTISAGNGYCSFEPVAIVLEGNQSNTTMFNSVIGNTIENNTSKFGDSAAAIFIWDSNGNIIVGNTIRNNVSSQGAVQMYNSQSIVFSQNLVDSNFNSGNIAAYSGTGGLYLAIPDGAPPFYGIIANNTFANNTTLQWNKGASQVYIDGDVSQYSFVNNILYGTGSYPLLVCSGLYADLSPGPMLVENNDGFNPSGPTYDSSCDNGAGMAGNIAADPLFVSPANHDFHLQSGSPAIDVGNNQALAMLTSYGIDLATDLDGNPRVQDATGKGCIIDMGAYEAPGTVNLCGVPETLTSSLNPAMAGQSVTFTARLSAASGTPTGTIQFLDGATVLSTQTVSVTGSASFTTSTLAIGSHTITANYQPTGTFGPGTASLIQVIDADATSTALTCLPNPININGAALLTATVTSAFGSPTGSVSFTDNGTFLAANPLVGGTTSLAYAGSVAGTHNIIATYVPTGSFAASSATCSEVVNTLPTTSALTATPATSTYGSPVTLTATVSPATLPGSSTPTGVVTFYNGASAIGTGTLAGGVASLVTGSLPGGSYNLTCMYGGSSIYAMSNCNPVSVVINAAPTSLTLSSSNNPATYSGPVTFTAVLLVNGKSAGAGNAITLRINGQIVTLTTDASGSATFTITTLAPNSYPVSASFAGNNSLLASSASLTEVIAVAPTSISLTATPNPGNVNQPITMSAIVSSLSTPVGSGTVTFYDGSTSLGSSPLSATGAANLITSFNALGVHNLTAAFGSSTDFSPATSAVVVETIVAGDFALAATPASRSILSGQTADFTITVAPNSGFNQPVALTCSGLQSGASCNFSPSTIQNGVGSSQLVIHFANQMARTGTREGSRHLWGYGIVAPLICVLLLVPGSLRRKSFLAALLLSCSAAVIGCGGQLLSLPPQGKYEIVVTGASNLSSGTLAHSTTISVDVKSSF